MEGQLQLGAMQFPRNSVKSIAEYHHFLEIMAGTYDAKIRNMRLPNRFHRGLPHGARTEAPHKRNFHALRRPVPLHI